MSEPKRDQPYPSIRVYPPTSLLSPYHPIYINRQAQQPATLSNVPQIIVQESTSFPVSRQNVGQSSRGFYPNQPTLETGLDMNTPARTPQNTGVTSTPAYYPLNGSVPTYHGLNRSLYTSRVGVAQEGASGEQSFAPQTQSGSFATPLPQQHKQLATPMTIPQSGGKTKEAVAAITANKRNRAPPKQRRQRASTLGRKANTKRSPPKTVHFAGVISDDDIPDAIEQEQARAAREVELQNQEAIFDFSFAGYDSATSEPESSDAEIPEPDIGHPFPIPADTDPAMIPVLEGLPPNHQYGSLFSLGGAIELAEDQHGHAHIRELKPVTCPHPYETCPMHKHLLLDSPLNPHGMDHQPPTPPNGSMVWLESDLHAGEAQSALLNPPKTPYSHLFPSIAGEWTTNKKDGTISRKTPISVQEAVAAKQALDTGKARCVDPEPEDDEYDYSNPDHTWESLSAPQSFFAMNEVPVSESEPEDEDESPVQDTPETLAQSPTPTPAPEATVNPFAEFVKDWEDTEWAKAMDRDEIVEDPEVPEGFWRDSRGFIWMDGNPGPGW